LIKVPVAWLVNALEDASEAVFVGSAFGLLALIFAAAPETGVIPAFVAGTHCAELLVLRLWLDGFR
jgi:hypothetical protein